MEIIKRGAEAILYIEEGKLVKERIKKSYRIKEIDEKIRRERTTREARLLHAACACVDVPQVFNVDKANFKIIMEYINGHRLKEYLMSCDEQRAAELAYEIGKIVGKLHAAKIIHGDLTTSNMILCEGRLFIFDFGLGFFSDRAEDAATDLSVLKEAVTSVHFKYLNSIWKNILRGYRETNPSAEKVIETLKKVELRGRYIKRGCECST